MSAFTPEHRERASLRAAQKKNQRLSIQVLSVGFSISAAALQILGLPTLSSESCVAWCLVVLLRFLLDDNDDNVN